VPIAHEALAFYEAIADPPTVVRARIRDHDHPATLEPGHRDRSCPIPRTDHSPDRNVDFDVQIQQLRHPIIGVVTELVVHLCAESAHSPTVNAGSDT
jgi:hypothetical protein